MTFNSASKKLTASLLCFLMIISALSFTAFADNNDQAENSDRVTSVPFRDIIPGMGNKVTIKFVKTDIRDALSALSAAFGYETVYIGSSATVTVALSQVTVEEAFNELVSAAGLKWKYDGQIIYVSDEKTLAKIDSSNVSASFSVQNTTTSFILTKIANVGIDVSVKEKTATESGFTASGKATDLVKLYELLKMIDIPEGNGSEQAGLYTVTTEYITANEFSRLLFSLDLPSGLTKENSVGNELVVYTTPSIYSKILSAREIADKKPDALYPSESALLLAKVETKNITASVADQLLTDLVGTNTVKMNEEKSTIWVYATAKQIESAKRVLSLADADGLTSEPTDLRLIELDFISASDFNKLLRHFEITTTHLFEDDAQRIYVFADSETQKDIDTLRMIADREEYVNNSSAGIVFHKYAPQFINKTAAADYLKAVGCGAQIVELFGADEAIWLYGDEESINYAIEMFALFDTEHFRDGYVYRVYEIQNTDFFGLSDTMVFDEEFAQYADYYYIIPIDEKTIIIAAHSMSSEEIYRFIQSFDVAPEK